MLDTLVTKCSLGLPCMLNVIFSCFSPILALRVGHWVQLNVFQVIAYTLLKRYMC